MIVQTKKKTKKQVEPQPFFNATNVAAGKENTEMLRTTFKNARRRRYVILTLF